MVDQLMNLLILLLIVLIGLLLSMLVEPTIVVPAIPDKSDHSLPQGWAQQGERWVCEPINMAAIGNMIRAIPHFEKPPKHIHLDPSKGDVIW